MNIIRNPHGPFGLLRKSNRSQLHAAQILDRAPLAVMMCDLDLIITYANEASISALRKIQHALPISVDRIVGQSIDIFHKNPTHQRRLLRDPKNLPHKARIKLGDEWLDLHVVAITDTKGAYIGPMLSWSIVTDEVRHAKETQKLLTMLDMMPINVMLADKDTLDITYANRTSMETLRPLEHQLPCKADEIIGKNIDIFHKKPIHQRTMLANHTATLPHRAVINLGSEKLELNISPLNTAQGDYVGPLLTWSVVTDSISVAAQIKEVMSSVASATTEMQASADALSNNAGQTNAQVATVASASEELSVSISEISRQITRSSNVAQAARSDMDHAARVMVDLTTAADKIDKVVSLINDIAEKTNLLALNATIEAARAGDAGKGFAVVASEVKALASQTGQATGEISAQVNGIQHAIKATAAANQAIGRTIVDINEIASSISAAIEQQLAATQNVAVNITEVSKASTETGRISGTVNAAAKELAERADGLQKAMMSFIARYTSAR